MGRLTYAVSVFLAFMFTGVSGLQAGNPIEAWIARYSGPPGNGPGYAYDLAVDAFDSVKRTYVSISEV